MNGTVFFNSLLQGRGLTLDALCDQLRKLPGDQAYQVLATMSGVKGYSKCLDFFVREALCLDAVPVDRRVRRMLKRFRLYHVRGQLPQLIREVGYEPRFVARFLYEAGTKDIGYVEAGGTTSASTTHTTPVIDGRAEKAPEYREDGLPSLPEYVPALSRWTLQEVNPSIPRR
jgi:hypothetical protein